MKTKNIILIAIIMLLISTVSCKKDHEIPTGKVFNSEYGGDTLVPGDDTIVLALPDGGLPGFFSVSASRRVWFSKGNLQYNSSTNTWRFAPNQYDYVGDSNANTSSTYSEWIDLFGWGTSGYNHGAVCFQPWSTSMTESDYRAYGSNSYNLNDQTGQADWGYNKIVNGGNVENLWHTLTISEWTYVLNNRNTNSGIRYAKAQVNDENGLVLLPDDWNSDYYTLNNFNDAESRFDSNIMSIDDWENILEPHGVVFLPAAGNREGTSIDGLGRFGEYWSTTNYGTQFALYASFGGLHVGQIIEKRCVGRSVRLVCPAY